MPIKSIEFFSALESLKYGGRGFDIIDSLTPLFPRIKMNKGCSIF